MAGVCAGVQKAIQGPSSPELNGEGEWAFIDSSNSLFKIDEVGPASTSQPGSGPSTFQIICGLLAALVLIFIISPLIKMLINLKSLFYCCWKKESGEYVVTYRGEESGTSRGTSKYTQTDHTPTPSPRYSLPPALTSTHDMKWDSSNIDSSPVIALPNSISSAESSESVANMESVYACLSNLEERTVQDHSSQKNVKFVKSGRLAEAIKKCQTQAEKRVVNEGIEQEEPGK